MAKGDWFFKFEIPAWRNAPELRRCSLATRGFWIDCIAIMRDSGVPTMTGTFADFARAVGCFPDEAEQCIEELKRNKTADVTLRNGCVTLKSRKFAKELKAKELTKLRVEKHRRNANVTLEKQPSLSKKLETSNKKEEKELPSGSYKKPPPHLRVIPKQTRIPEDFGLTPERWAWLTENVPDLDDPVGAHANFVEHWTNAPPGKGEKIDWNLTWQKGMRLAKKWQDEDKKNGSNRIGIGTNGKITPAERIRGRSYR